VQISVYDCTFCKGKQAAKDGTLVIRGRTAVLHDLCLKEVASERLPAATAEALHQAYVAAVASSHRDEPLWEEEQPSVGMGPMRVEIENQAAAAVMAEEWAVRQRLQQQVLQQQVWTCNCTSHELHAPGQPKLVLNIISI
jgi:hypothetical protein